MASAPPQLERSLSQNSSFRSFTPVLTRQQSAGSPRNGNADEPDDCLKEGYLEKMGAQVKNWKKRWFVLYPDQLLYFKDQKNFQKGSRPLGKILISASTVVLSDRAAKRPNCFSVMAITGARRYLISADDESVKDSWVTALVNLVAGIATETAQATTSFQKAFGQLATLERTLEAQEWYLLINDMLMVAPTSQHCSSIMTTARQMEEEAKHEYEVFAAVLKQLFGIFTTKEEAPMAPEETEPEPETSVAPEEEPLMTDRVGLVKKAFVFCKGPDALLRLWHHMLLATGDNATHLQRWILRLIRVVETHCFDEAVNAEELDLTVATSVYVDNTRVMSEKQSLDYALYTLRVSIADTCWYVDRKFGDVKGFMEKVKQELKSRGQIALFPTNCSISSSMSANSQRVMIDRLRKFNDFFQNLNASAEAWEIVTSMPSFSDFCELKEFAEQQRDTRPYKSSLMKKAVEVAVASQLTDDGKLMKLLTQILFEIVLGDDVGAADKPTYPGNSCMAGQLKRADYLPHLLQALDASFPDVRLKGLESIHLLLRNQDNVLALLDVPEWALNFVPFLSSHSQSAVQYKSSPAGLMATSGGEKVRVELAVKCRDLIKMDVLSKSDPCVELYGQDPRDAMAREVLMDRTEVIQDDHNPEFVNRFYVDFDPKQLPRQKLRFVVYDSDFSQLRRQDRMGYVAPVLQDLLLDRVSELPMSLFVRPAKSEVGLNPRFVIIATPVAEPQDLSKLDVEIPKEAMWHPEKHAPSLISISEEANTKQTPALGKNESIVCYCPHFVSEQVIQLKHDPNLLEHSLKNCTILTDRRLLFQEGYVTVCDIWRNNVARVQLRMDCRLKVITCQGAVQLTPPMSEKTARMLYAVLQQDVPVPVAPELPAEESSGRAEYKLSILCLLDVLQQSFTTATDRRHHQRSFNARLFDLVDHIADQFWWDTSSPMLPILRSLLTSFLTLVGNMIDRYINDYDSPFMHNVHRLAAALLSMVAYKPSVKSAKPELRGDRRHIRKAGGLPIINIKIVRSFMDLYNRLKLKELDHAAIVDQADKAQLIKLQKKNLPFMRKWGQMLEALEAQEEGSGAASTRTLQYELSATSINKAAADAEEADSSDEELVYDEEDDEDEDLPPPPAADDAEPEA